MATYKERVAALKKAGEETKRKRAEAKAKKKPGLFGKMKEKLKAKKVAKQKKAGGVKTGVQKAPKYKGAPKAPKTSKLGKEAGAKRKKAAADKSWTKAVKKQKEGGSGETLSSLVAKREGLTKGSAEYASVQNKINKAYGVKKRHTTTAESRSKTKPFSPGSKEDVKGKEKEVQLKKEGTYAEGGKVESNPYGWPTKDSRNR